nr:hypothetical protein [Tanacetum cinerariifolium]GEW43504.1 hypothetical protein [Tanacetum cinerariifolium]
MGKKLLSLIKSMLQAKEQAPQNLVRPVPDEDLREYCDKNYHQILPIIADKLHQEKVQQEKLKAVKARLNFEEASQYSESETPNRRRNLKESLGPRGARTRSISPEQRRGRSKSPKEKGSESRTVFKRLEKGVFHRLGDKEKNVFAHSKGLERKSYYSSRREAESCYQKRKQNQKAKEVQKGTGSQNQRSKSQAWRMTYPNHGVWFDDLPKESIDSYNDLKKAFLENYLQQKKRIKDPVEIHNIKQRNGESTEEFMRRYKLECRDVKGALECMKISGFMHGITNSELIKRLHDEIPQSMDEIMSVTATFLKGEMAASNRNEKSYFPPGSKKPDRSKTLRGETSEMNKLEKRNASKFCKFHREVGHTTDQCMHLKRQIKEMLKAGKLSYFIKELKQNNEKDQAKTAKKGETSEKDKPLAILMVQPWQRIARTEGFMIIEAEMGGHYVHRIYVDGGSSLEILYEHCFSKFRPEIKNQLIPANNLLVGFSGEIIWPLRLISLLVKIGDEEHSTSARLNFMVVRSPSPNNGIIGRPGIRKIRAVPFTAHGMIIFPVAGGIVTLQSSRIIPLECSMVLKPKEGRKELCGLLRRHLDVFAWKPTDMTGVPRHIAEHRLNVREGCLPMSWRMCVDFKDLNKACPKDGYPLPEIDWKVESLYGYPYKCFLDAYKGYHQIKMAEEDEEKIAFITSQGIFCQNFKVYVDDLVIKSRTEEEFIRDAEETFKTLRKINMKLNPKKCAFGMREGTFLGYRVDADGLRVSPDKVKVVIDLPSPKCLKDVRKLNGKLASLNRFLSKSAEKSLPFFKMLKKCTKKSDFHWTLEAEEVFKEMKQSIAELPMPTTPKSKEELIIYLAAAKEAISAVLMTNRDGKQWPIYFVSRALQGPEVNYTPMEKLILALVSAKVTRRLLKWRFELGEHDIQYRPRTSVKGQILADFIVERPEDGTPNTPIEDREELPDPWILFTDGSSCVDGFGAGLIIMNPKGMEFAYALRFRFNATNNEAEYEALIAGLRIASQMGIQNLQANVDSKLVANQQIPIGENKKTDALSKITSTSFAHLSKQVLVEELRKKAIDEKEVVALVEEEGHTWMTPVYEYLTEGVLPEEKKKARTVRRKARRYAVISEVLYKKSFLGSWLWCVGPLQANYVLRKIHERSCNMHAGPRFVVAKALRLGYFWPTMHTDARNLIRQCKDCQVHRPVPKNPQEKLTPITSPWPFYKWGIDIAGPFPKGPDKVKFLIVAIDYFTKWIEAKLVASITGAQVKKFVWDNIVCRVRSTSFRPGDLVYRNNEASHMESGGKLGPKWEGPYEVTEALGKGAYNLKDRNRLTLSQT